MDLDKRSVDIVLTTTRAVRRRMNFARAVDPDVIRECIELATYAPSAGNGQDWRWIVVTDTAKRRAVAEIVRNAGGASGRAIGAPVDARIVQSSRYLLDHLHDVPAFVFACLLSRLSTGASGRALTDFYGSILPAVWSLQLALRTRGLGSVFTTRFLAHEVQIMELLGIPSGVTPVVMIPVAHYEGELTRASRVSVDEVIFWEHWDERRRHGTTR